MKKILWIVFISLFGVNTTAMAAAKAKIRPSVSIGKLKQEAFLPWLPDAKATQSKIFDYLRTKTSETLLKPSFPVNDLVKWSNERYANVGKEQSEIYKLIYEDLLISNDLLNRKELQQRRRGLRLVTLTNLYVYTLLQDHSLHSQIYEGFILPYLDISYRKKWQDLSRQRLVEGSANAFKRSSETDKQISVLKLLLTLHTSQNTTRPLAKVKIASKRVKATGCHFERSREILSFHLAKRFLHSAALRSK